MVTHTLLKMMMGGRRNYSPSLLSFISLMFISLHLFSLISRTSQLQLAPALYVFGDSLFDSGNNNYLMTIAKANYLPYGANFPKGSTGRFTNGKTVVDFIAEFLGLPYSPPYLSFGTNSVPLTGLNYASGSCGILRETGVTFGKCLNFKEQIDLFEKTVESELPRQFKSSKELSDYLSKSIVVISIGSNDYLNNYLATPLFDTSKRYSPQEFAQLLVDALRPQLERLYNLGARKIIMFEIGPIGCIPSITRRYKHDGKCVEDKNQLVLHFNERLPAMLANLTTTLKGSSFVLGRGHWLGYDAAINPFKYGLVDSTSPCCTAWFNGTSGCIPLLSPCPNPDKHYFWDAYHLTGIVYSVIASRCINDTSVCIPFNLEELVKM